MPRPNLATSQFHRLPISGERQNMILSVHSTSTTIAGGQTSSINRRPALFTAGSSPATPHLADTTRSFIDLPFPSQATHVELLWLQSPTGVCSSEVTPPPHREVHHGRGAHVVNGSWTESVDFPMVKQFQNPRKSQSFTYSLLPFFFERALFEYKLIKLTHYMYTTHMPHTPHTYNV
jgi:hypothetical protein